MIVTPDDMKALLDEVASLPQVPRLPPGYKFVVSDFVDFCDAVGATLSTEAPPILFSHNGIPVEIHPWVPPGYVVEMWDSDYRVHRYR